MKHKRSDLFHDAFAEVLSSVEAVWYNIGPDLRLYGMGRQTVILWNGGKKDGQNDVAGA